MQAKVKSGSAILRERYIRDDPEMERRVAEAEADMEMAQALYDLRTEAGLTQEALAERVGVPASVVDDLEQADYAGHAFAMLRRIAAVLGKRVAVDIVPEEPRPDEGEIELPGPSTEPELSGTR